ncbi:hypothetical protein ACE5IS_06605 [Leptospira wolffii]|uniref:Uncharacterized protein n=1 Tax=Leptospira wolffii TaxID=409998 RepID=A0ABV5BI77_9LEPT|nr:hypothetical protein [Leptospira wolffii]TGL51991.1 hypothetical protein EHQ61_07185 [Leptospira wolffii]
MIWFIKSLSRIPGWEKGTVLVRRLQELSLTSKLFLVYSVFAVYFLLYHESHLPLFWMISLSLVGYFASTFFFWLIVFAYRRLETRVVLPAIFAEVGISRPTTALVPWMEGGLFLISVLICYITGFFDNRSGILFFAVYSLGVVFLRLIEDKLFYKIGLLGILVLAAGLISFKALQLSETWVAYVLFKPAFEEKNAEDWKFDEQERIVSNAEFGIHFKLPEDFYFHNPKNLNLEDKTGVGQIIGAISSSDTDPSRYPSIRIFYFPHRYQNEDQLVSDFKKYLDLLTKRGDIQEVNELESETLNGRYVGKFWTLYDVLRPRYAKMGMFSLAHQNRSDTFMFVIAESLIKNRRHEESIESILTSVNVDQKE